MDETAWVHDFNTTSNDKYDKEPGGMPTLRKLSAILVDLFSSNSESIKCLLLYTLQKTGHSLHPTPTPI